MRTENEVAMNIKARKIAGSRCLVGIHRALIVKRLVIKHGSDNLSHIEGESIRHLRVREPYDFRPSQSGKNKDNRNTRGFQRPLGRRGQASCIMKGRPKGNTQKSSLYQTRWWQKKGETSTTLVRRCRARSKSHGYLQLAGAKVLRRL